MAPPAAPRLACLFLLCAVCAPAAAQPRTEGAAPEHDAAPPHAVRTDGGAAGDERAARPLVVFLLPDADAASAAELRDALLAQFALIDATLVFEPAPSEQASLSARMEHAQAVAAKHDAVAVFWLDEEPNGHWLLHMMDPQGARVIVRAVDASGEHTPAASEAVAVMARSSARALIEKVAVPSNTPAVVVLPAPAAAKAAPKEPAPLPPPLPLREDLRLWMGYAGDDFAPHMWQHGAALGASWLGLRPVFFGLGLSLVPAIERTTATVSFTVQRLPVTAAAGYRLTYGRLALDGELGIALEWLHRLDAQPGQVMGGTVTAGGPAPPRWLVELAPRLRGEVRVVPFAAVYAAGGIDILLNKFQYISEGPARDVLLDPKSLRLVAELGVSLYL